MLRPPSIEGADRRAPGGRPGRSPLDAARRLVPILERDAPLIDRDGVFPERALTELRRSGLMGLMVPEAYGGVGASYRTMSEVGRILGEACMSTALIWGMHCQQVAVLVHHASEELRRRILPRVAAGAAYIASVTSERGKGGHLLTALAPLAVDGDGIVLHREAPVVTGGSRADGFLVTMRSGPEAPLSDVQLVWAERDQLQLTVNGAWDAMGARGTQSVGMTLSGRVPRGQIIGGEGGFREIALMTMVPVGHIAWASSWLGAATGIFRKAVAVLREPKTRANYDVTSDLFAANLAEVRTDLGVVSSCLNQTLDVYEALCRRSPRRLADYEAPAFQIQINELKLVASRRAFSAVNRLMEIGGLRHGYLRNPVLPIERVFRDLCSARLMYANDRLLVANGKLALLDREVTLP